MRPRLMLFTDSFLHGGTEGQFVHTVRHLDGRKYDITLACLQRQGPLLEAVATLGVPLVEFPLNSLYNARAMRLFGRLVRFLRQQRIELVHTFDFYTTVFAVPAARLAGVPVVLASRRELVPLRGTWQRRAFSFACRLATRVVVNSRAAQASLQNGRSPSAEVVVVHNSIDLETFRPVAMSEAVRGRLGIPAAAPLAGITANLRPEKDLATFVRAAAAVSEALPAARFLMIGDGPERSSLERLAGELGVRDKICFAGDRTDVPDLVAALDVFVLSSHSESFPNAILEAMALSRPVVATAVGGVPELVEDEKTGFLVPLGDVRSMSERILELLRDPRARQRMGAAGRTRVEQEFTTGKMREKLEYLYDQLLAESRSRAS